MIINLSIPGNVIAALSICAAQSDPRAKLNAITFEAERGSLYCVATDGKLMLVAHAPWNGPKLSAIVPIELFPRPSSVKGDSLRMYIEIEGQQVTVSYSKHRTVGTLVDTPPLDWRKAIPAETDGVLAHFDPRLLHTIRRAHEYLHSKGYGDSPLIHHNGRKCSIVDMGREDVLCLLMPFYEDRTFRGSRPPEWALPKVGLA